MTARASTPNGELPARKGTPRLYERDSLHARLGGSPASSTASTPRKDGRLGGTRLVGPKATNFSSPPPQAVLNANITPRSSARRARRESELSTSSVQSPTNLISAGNFNPNGSQSMRASANGFTTPAMESSNRTSASDRIHPRAHQNRSHSGTSSLAGSSITTPENAPKFFHADEANSVLSNKSQSPLHSPMYERSQPMFFHANGDSDENVPKTASSFSPVAPPSNSPFGILAQPPKNRPPRAPSPLKDEIVSRSSSVTKPSPRRHTRLVSNGSNVAEHEIRAPESTLPGTRSSSRRSSISSPTPQVVARPKSMSFDRGSQLPVRRSSLTLSDAGGPPPALPRSRPSSAASRSRRGSIARGDLQEISRTRPPLTTIPSQSLPQTEDPPPMSPIRTSDGQSKLDHMNELAANARRDRKVLDLEISNSSLLAINRTLEREMRKQKEELRNLRRFARSASGRVSSRGTLGRISDLSGVKASDLQSDMLSDDQLSDFDDQSLSSTNTSSPPTSDYHPSALPRIRHSTKSQTLKSFHLEDLARQRALLLDGQKLNQAIKRCLDSTETLIADGKKALAYKASAPKVEPRGGKVLAHDLDEEDPNHNGVDGWNGMRQGLLSPAIAWPPNKNPWEPHDFAPTPAAADDDASPQNKDEQLLSSDLTSSPIEVDDIALPSPGQALPGASIHTDLELDDDRSDRSYSPPPSPSPQNARASLPINLPSDPLPQASSPPSSIPPSSTLPRGPTTYSSPPPSSPPPPPPPFSNPPSPIPNNDDDELSTPSRTSSTPSPPSQPHNHYREPLPSSTTSRIEDPSSPAPLQEENDPSSSPPNAAAAPIMKARPLSITSLGLGIGMGNYLQSLQGSLGLN